MTTSYIHDHNAILDLLKQYGEGGAKADSRLMKPAFHEKATMFGVDDGQLVGGGIDNLYQVIDSAFTPSPQARGVVAYVDIVGTAASARVDTDDLSGFCFTDYFNLLKVEGRWTIVSKIYHTRSAA